MISPPITVTVGTMLGMLECVTGGVGEVAGFSAVGSVKEAREREQDVMMHSRNIKTFIRETLCIAHNGHITS